MRRLLAASVAALGVAGAGVHLASVALSGRAQEPAERLAGAAAALGRARPVATRWAPRELADAERRMAAAEAGYRSERLRWLPRRDFTQVARLCWRAERAAIAALAAGEEQRETARGDAQDALADAADLLEHADQLANHTILPESTRRRLSRARLSLVEGQLLYGQADYDAALARASQGRDSLFAALGGVVEVARRYTAEEQIETWRRWVELTQEWSRRSERPAVVVYKEKNRLVVLQRGEPIRDYPADIGASGLGRKLRQGDRATPEGRYRVVRKKGAGESRYYKALLLDYPNAEDRRRTAEARRDGRLPPDSVPGGSIEIHGEGGRGSNWTDGCVALSNPDMDELFDRVEVGSWVTIVGGDGRDGILTRLAARLESRGGAR